jgi:anti-sigma factor RsiW
MTCREVEDLLIDLQDGRLDAARELRVHAHVEGCAACRERAQLWRTLVPAMRPLAPPPPSPFDERRMMADIERRLATASVRPARSLRQPRRLFGLAAVAAAACLLLAWRARVPHGVGVPAYGSVVAHDGELLVDGRPLAPNSALRAGTRLLVAAGGHADVTIHGSASLALTGPSALVLEGDGAHVRLRLDDGQLEAAVVHRAPGETFTVVTPDGRVEVRGTRFVVAAGGAGSWVHVSEGRVAIFDRRGDEHMVSAGETRDFSPPVARLASPALPATPVPMPVEPTIVRPHEVCSEPKVDCDHLTQEARMLMRDRRYGEALAALGPALAPRAACARRTLSCRDELGYLRAEALRLMGRLEDAVAAYRALDRAAAPPTMRQNALYAAAQLERRLGRLGAARVDYEGALIAFPAGPLREEAMLGALESADRTGDGDAALAAARRYLAAFPRGIGANEARRIESNLGAGRGSAP